MPIYLSPFFSRLFFIGGKRVGSERGLLVIKEKGRYGSHTLIHAEHEYSGRHQIGNLKAGGNSDGHIFHNILLCNFFSFKLMASSFANRGMLYMCV